MNTPYLRLLPLALLLPGIAVAQITTWTGDHSGDRFNQAANWDNGVPVAGGTGNVGGNARVEIGAATEMSVGATINMNDSSYIERNGNANMQWSTTLNFNDSSSLITSELRQNAGTTLNWNSTGSFTTAVAAAQPNFTATGGIANMSAGTWTLAGNTHANDAYNTRGSHVFNFTGGTIAMDKRMRIGQDTPATFNLGSGGSLYIGSLFMNITGSVLNFAPGATLHIASAASFNERLGDGFLAIDGTVTTDLDDFIFGTPVILDLGFGDVSYTPITAIPEPRTYALIAGLAALFFMGLRRRLTR